MATVNNKPAQRALQKTETRQALIQKAAQLFATNGIAATPTSEIAKATQVSHGTVFLHFPTREDLILAVVDSVGANLSQKLTAALEVKEDAGIRAVLSAHLATLSEFEDFYFRLLTEIYALPPSVRSQLFILNANISWHLFEAAKPLIASGRLKKIPRAQIFNTWMAMVNYTVTHRDQFSNTTPILKAKAQDLMNHFELLLCNDPTNSENQNKEKESRHDNINNKQLDQ